MNSVHEKRIFLLVLTSFFICILPLEAQRERSLTMGMIQKLQTSYANHPADSATCHAVSSNDIRKLITQCNNSTSIDHHFSIVVKSSGITDQKNSGRCWLFSTMNILRAEMMQELHLNSFEFSQNYNYFWDMLEKSNMFLETVVAFRNRPITDEANLWLFKKPIADGGQFMNAANIIQKYGLVPKTAMPETYQSENNATLLSLLRTKLREYGLKLRKPNLSDSDINKIKEDGLKDIYRLLILTLGTPPSSFTYEGKVYTPQSFRATFVHHDLQQDYVMLMNDPTRAYYQVYTVDWRRNCYDGLPWKYINLPMEQLRKIVVRSLRGNAMVYFSCDVDKYYDRTTGQLNMNAFDYYSALGVHFPMNKKERIESCDSFSDHAMAICGVDLNKDGEPTKWLVENSYGIERPDKGHLIMEDAWFGEYTFRMAAEKKYLSADILKLLSLKSTHIAAWYPNW